MMRCRSSTSRYLAQRGKRQSSLRMDRHPSAGHFFLGATQGRHSSRTFSRSDNYRRRDWTRAEIDIVVLGNLAITLEPPPCESARGSRQPRYGTCSFSRLAHRFFCAK